jgi:hypothetical protein
LGMPKSGSNSEQHRIEILHAENNEGSPPTWVWNG